MPRPAPGPPPDCRYRCPFVVVSLLGAIALVSCKVVPANALPPGLDPADDTRASVGEPDTLSDPASVDFLLSMDFREASLMAARTMELPPLFRVAAADISHPALEPGQALSEFTATGNVFLEIRFAEPLTALAQEAEVSIREIILRGRPVLKRGQSVIEATSRETVFYLTSDAIEIDGPHQLRRLGDAPPDLAPAQPTSAVIGPAVGPDVTTEAADGPAPITIDPSQVPADMTAEEIQRLISGQE